MKSLDQYARANTTPKAPRRHSLLGATGMTRAALARLFIENGLFGRESDLSADQRATVRHTLGALPGVPAAARLPQASATLDALTAFVGVVIAQTDARAARARLHAMGLHTRAVDEAERVVENVREVFGFANRTCLQSRPDSLARAA